MSAPRCRKGSRATQGLRVSDKRNLTCTQRPIVANLLNNPDAVSYFLCYCHAIYRNWLLGQQPLRSDSSIDTSVVAAFDILHEFSASKRACRLLLRLAYIQLTWVIDAYKAVAAANRTERAVGHGDATVAINLYLDSKRKVPGERMKRSQLSGYCRTGRPWAALAGRSPILVLIFPTIADTVVYVPRLLPFFSMTHIVDKQNNSIRDSTIRDLCGQVERDHPELVQI